MDTAHGIMLLALAGVGVGLLMARRARVEMDRLHKRALGQVNALLNQVAALHEEQRTYVATLAQVRRDRTTLQAELARLRRVYKVKS